jgi:hypothetical protein
VRPKKKSFRKQRREQQGPEKKVLPPLATIRDRIRDLIAALRSADLLKVHDSRNILYWSLTNSSLLILDNVYEAKPPEVKAAIQKLFQVVEPYGYHLHRYADLKVQELSAILKALAPKQSSNEERDKFIHESREVGKTLAWIKSKIDDHTEWDSLSVSGISEADRRYVKRHSLHV